MNLSVNLKHIMILTGEPSGDLHGGNLVKEIKKLNKSVIFSGIGGKHLEKEDVNLFFNIANLSVMGLVEVIMQFKQIKYAFDLFKKNIEHNRPNLLILIDYPGFNLKAAKFVKEYYNIKILYYITPKVWAWNKSRLKKIKKYVDHAALILPFEEKIYKKANIPSTYVGNPLMDDYPENLSKPFLKRDNLPSNRPLIIALLPGSRKTEINNLLKIMIKAADQIYANLKSQKNQEVSFMISKADSISKELLVAGIKESAHQEMFQIKEGAVKDILIKSDLIIAASGTVTLEAALCCVPTIIIYKMSWLTFQVAKQVVKIQYVGLANLIIDREVMPEFLQDNASHDKISKKVISMLENLPCYEKQLQLVRKMLGDKGASLRVAKIALKMI